MGFDEVVAVGNDIGDFRNKYTTTPPTAIPPSSRIQSHVSIAINIE